MTIIEAINRTDSLVRNAYSQEEKVGWLSRLDWIVKRQIIDTHEGGEKTRFTGYDDSADLHGELLVPAPYDEIYLRWLEAQIHYANGEIEKYNVAITMYNTAMEAYENHYNRNHMPLSAGARFLF